MRDKSHSVVSSEEGEKEEANGIIWQEEGYFRLRESSQLLSKSLYCRHLSPSPMGEDSPDLVRA